MLFQLLEDTHPNDDFIRGMGQSNLNGLHIQRKWGRSYSYDPILMPLSAFTYFRSAICRRALLARSLASGIRSIAFRT